MVLEELASMRATHHLHLGDKGTWELATATPLGKAGSCMQEAKGQ